MLRTISKYGKIIPNHVYFSDGKCFHVNFYAYEVYGIIKPTRNLYDNFLTIGQFQLMYGSINIQKIVREVQEYEKSLLSS